MKRLNSLFEEDIEMQDAIEDLDDLVDDSDGMLIDVIEEHYKDNGLHLFSESNEDPELAPYIDMLVNDNKEEEELAAAEIEDDVIDAAIPEEDIIAAEKTIAKD